MGPKTRAGAAFLSLVLLLAILIVYGPIAAYRNAAYVAVLHLYRGALSHEGTMRWAGFATRAACSTHLCRNCCAKSLTTTEELLINLDAVLVRSGTPLRWLDTDLQLPAKDMQLGGPSASSRFMKDYVALYGLSYIEARLFVPVNQPMSVTVKVEAVHDYPPPVTLVVEVNEQSAAVLEYQRGDGSWGVQSATIPFHAGFSRVRVWFVNDLFDAEQGLDRNALVRQVTFLPRGQSR